MNLYHLLFYSNGPIITLLIGLIFQFITPLSWLSSPLILISLIWYLFRIVYKTPKKRF